MKSLIIMPEFRSKYKIKNPTNVTKRNNKPKNKQNT